MSGAAALEQQALRTLLALLVASPGPASAVLLQQQGAPLAQLVELLGWPLAPADAQQPPQPAQPLDTAAEQQGAQAAGRVGSGSGLRPAAEELEVQLLALRALGVAARSGGSACLALLRDRGAFPRTTQLLQWAALTFDAAPAAPGGGQLSQLFGALWGWLSGGGGAGTAVALLPQLLQAQLAAFQPAEPPAGAAAACSPDQLHQAAVAALCSPGGCGCALQQQTLLYAARLIGREQRVRPLLPAGAGQEAEGEGAVAPGSVQALSNLQALRAAGERGMGAARARCLRTGRWVASAGCLC